MLTMTLLLTGAFVSPAIAASTPSSLQGDVRGIDGRPMSGADVRIERKDRISPVITAKTDARGHYSSPGLSVGLYQLSVIENGALKSSVSVRTAERDARIDFDLKPAVGKKVKHYVWMPSDTGSHLNARWVEVEDSSAVAGTWNTERKSAELARELLRHQNNTKN